MHWEQLFEAREPKSLKRQHLIIPRDTQTGGALGKENLQSTSIHFMCDNGNRTQVNMID